jgi:HD-GYP domain-containing protein (c-di-GMP phosphodiesterase class II)
MLIGDTSSFVTAAAVLTASALALIVLALLHDLRAPVVFVLLAAALIAGAGGLLGWLRAVRAATAVATLEAETATEEDRLREQAGAQERELERARSDARLQREWIGELRREIWELQSLHGALGDTSDTRRLVLATAIRLIGAEKGLLLSRDDADGDGDLDLVCAEGFDGDPEHSTVAQRFAREVLDRDETVREDDPGDPEIDNLVAIPLYIRDRFDGVIVCCNKPGGFNEYDDQVLLALGDHAGAVLHNERLHGQVRGAYLATVSVLADAIQAKDPFLRGHSDEVARYVATVADRLGVPVELREQLVFGSLLHDVGKLGISERILLKPAALTPEERSVVELHPRIGYRLVEQVPALRAIAAGVLHHHERFDGGGYPSKLKGEAIPVEARIIAVADSFSAMTAERPYRPAMTVEEACTELERCAGSQFDPEIVKLFVEEVRRNPPRPLAEADDTLRDPELALQRDGDEPVLGFGSFAIVDNLTLLYSRRYLHDVARAEAHRGEVQGKPFALLLLELTDLDRLNAEHGFASGDDAIRQAARTLERLAARCGGTACRYSGRRLAVVVPGADKAICDRLAEELAQDLGHGPSARIRCAVWRDGESGDDVIARAAAGTPAHTLTR